MTCSTDTADIWFKVTKPVGVFNLTVTTASSAPACNAALGTTVELILPVVVH